MAQVHFESLCPDPFPEFLANIHQSTIRALSAISLHAISVIMTSNHKQLSQAEIDNRNMQKAIADGIQRPEKVRAFSDQILTFVLAKNWKFHHGTLESASKERYFLQAALGRKVRIFKIWNTGRKQVQDDMSLLRGMLSETESWDPAFEALDRILKGAGY